MARSGAMRGHRQIGRYSVFMDSHALLVGLNLAKAEISASREGLERIPIPRYEPTLAALDVRESAESVQLWLIDPVGVVEATARRASGMGSKRGSDTRSRWRTTRFRI